MISKFRQNGAFLGVFVAICAWMVPLQAEDGNLSDAPKVKLAKPVAEDSPSRADSKSVDDSEKPENTDTVEPKKTDPEQVVAVKNIEVLPQAKAVHSQSSESMSIGASVSLMNTVGEIHNYLDTAIGFGLFGQMKIQEFPITLFAQMGYFNASSYRVQSMSFLYAQAGIGWPIELPEDLTITPYVAGGIHTGKYKAATGDIATNFLVASFDAGGMLSYALNRQIAIVAKGGFMPVLDKFISTNFWHLGLGATYAF